MPNLQGPLSWNLKISIVELISKNRVEAAEVRGMQEKPFDVEGSRKMRVINQYSGLELWLRIKLTFFKASWCKITFGECEMYCGSETERLWRDGRLREEETWGKPRGKLPLYSFFNQAPKLSAQPSNANQFGR